MLKKLRIIPILFFVITIFSCNFHLLYPVPTDSQIASQMIPNLKYLKGELEKGSGTEMQNIFPEGYFFSYVLYGLSWIDLAILNPNDKNLKMKSLKESRWAFSHLISNECKEQFPKSLPPDHGMFYSAWTNYLLSGIILIQDKDNYNQSELNDFYQRCNDIYKSIKDHPIPYLESYKNQAWPVDTFPAIVSLKIYSHIADSKYDEFITNWTNEIKRYLDETTKLIPHKIDAFSGKTIQGSRATSMTLILKFLSQIDHNTGHRYYIKFRDKFLITKLGLPAILEYPAGINGQGDIDSGPLRFGVSLSATVNFMGTSKLYGDLDIYKTLWKFGDAISFPFTINKKRRHAFGILPIGDAFVVWSKVSTPWLKKFIQPKDTVKLSFAWQLVFHSISFLITIIFLYAGLKILRKKEVQTVQKKFDVKIKLKKPKYQKK